MKPEAKMRSDFCKLTEELHPVMLENLISKEAGTPDVWLANCAVELKQAKSWPKRPTTPLRLKHFTQKQRDWARDRVAAGGEWFLVLRVCTEWYVFDLD